MTRGLWITRALPFPLDTGDRIYTAQLMRAVAECGADLTVTGFAPETGQAAPADWPAARPIRWLTVPGTPRGTLRALASTMPLVAAAHATPAYRALIEQLALERWDFVVIDQYGSGWALAPFVRQRGDADAPVIVHVAHDHEASLYRSLVRGFRGSPLKRLGLWQNALKTAHFERRIVRGVDLVTAITSEDAARFALDAPGTPSVVLTPGYDGPVAPPASAGHVAARNVIMVGNYRWVAKSENLRQFVAAADAEFHAHGITLQVIGAMPEALAQELRASTRAVELLGFVDDIAPLFANARMAVVAEGIGGGFKLKYLDYIFGRVPVATLTQPTAGLPDEIRNAMIRSDDLPGLVQAVGDHIDDTAALAAMQAAALDAAQTRYRWPDRGRDLLAAIQQCTSRRRRTSMKTVLVYKSDLLPYSETFIKEQVTACRRWHPVLIGDRHVDGGLPLNGLDLRLLHEGRTGRAHRLWRQLWREADRPTPGVVSRLKAENADLVHVHFGTEAVAMWPALRALGLPVLVTLHGSDINIYREWWERPGTGPASRRYPDRLVQMSRHDDVRFIAVSEAVRARAISYGIAASKLTVKHIGIDVERFRPSGRPVEQRAPRVLYVGRMVEKKGGQYLIDAFAALRRQLPDAELVMVGDGPLLQSFKDRAAALGAPVQFRGRMASEDVRREIEQARVFCLPSITAENGDAEGLAIVILEAQACGVPVVTSARGGATEGILDGQTGLAFGERDVPALTAALTRLLADPALAGRMALASRAFATSRFDIRRCTAALEDEYDRFARAPTMSLRLEGSPA